MTTITLFTRDGNAATYEKVQNWKTEALEVDFVAEDGARVVSSLPYLIEEVPSG